MGLLNLDSQSQFNMYGMGQDDKASEDCLVLNVYSLDVKAKKAVMVFIHGGGYFMGSGNRNFYGPELFLDHDIVSLHLLLYCQSCDTDMLCIFC